MEFIDFDHRKDPEAIAKFAQWQDARRKKREREADILSRTKQQGKPADALVLVELAAASFLLHLETCPLLAGTPNARKIVHATFPDMWEQLEDAATGAAVADCATCNPRHELREIFAAFRRECIKLRRYFNTCKKLFHDAEPRRVLERSAAHVFVDINNVLVDACWLQASRLTDRARMSGKECLTVDYVNEALDAAQLLTDPIRDAAKAVMRYRGLVLDARHQLICHANKATILARGSPGGHAPQEVDTFLEQLQVYNDEVGRAVGEGPLDFKVQAQEGDAITLLQCLRVALQVRNTDKEAWFRAANKPVPE